MLVAMLSSCLLVIGMGKMRDLIRRIRRARQRARHWQRYVQAKRLQAVHRRSLATAWHPDGYAQPGEAE